MKRMSLAFILPLLLCAACARQVVKPQQVENIWTLPDAEWVYYIPKILSTAEEAVANIKNLQNRMMFNGLVPSELDVDKYGLRAKLRWVTTEKGEKVTSSSGGFFIGWNWVNTSSYATEPWTKETPQEQLIIIPFKDITQIQLLANNSVDLRMNRSGTAYEEILRTQDEGAGKDMIDSLYTLKEKTTGIKTQFYPTIGVYLANLTQSQKDALGVSSGMLITSSGKGGPAAMAGLKYPDVVTEVNGIPVLDKDDGHKKIMDSPKAVKLKVVKWAADEHYERGVPKPTGITSDGGKTTTYNYGEYREWQLHKQHLPTLDKSNIRVVEMTIEKK